MTTVETLEEAKAEVSDAACERLSFAVVVVRTPTLRVEMVGRELLKMVMKEVVLSW